MIFRLYPMQHNIVLNIGDLFSTEGTPEGEDASGWFVEKGG